MSSCVYAIAGGKGGVGKSTTTVNLAVALRMDGYSVAIVDADIEMPNLVEMLSIDPEITLHDVLRGDAETQDAIVEIGNGFAAIPGDPSLTGFGSIESNELQTVINDLKDTYELILVDTGAGLSYDDLLPLALSDEILLVASPDSASVKNVKRTNTLIQTLNKRVRGIVITNATKSVNTATIANELEAEVLAVIPREEEVRQSTAAGKPLEAFAPKSDAAQAYRRLEAAITDGELPPSRVDQTTSDEAKSQADSTDEEREAEDSPQKETEGDNAQEEPDDSTKGGVLTRISKLLSI